jgi:hypothetical protein
MRKRYVLSGAHMLVIVVAAGCSNDSVGPVTECVVADSRGASWTRSDLTPLGAEDAALIACGQQSADPTSCVVTKCQPRW